MAARNRAEHAGLDLIQKEHSALFLDDWSILRVWENKDGEQMEERRKRQKKNGVSHYDWTFLQGFRLQFLFYLFIFPCVTLSLPIHWLAAFVLPRKRDSEGIIFAPYIDYRLYNILDYITSEYIQPLVESIDTPPPQQRSPCLEFITYFLFHHYCLRVQVRTGSEVVIAE